MPATARFDDTVPRTLSRFSGRARLLSALPVLAALACAAPAQRPMDELVRQGDVFLDPESLEPFSGTAFSTFANRQIRSKEFYQKGRKHGPYQWYSDDGRLFEEGTYHQGVLDGPYEAYWESGDLYERGTYVAGDFDGSRAWYRKGELIELVTYVNGVIDGPYERFDIDGSIDLLGVLRDGVPCGPWVEGTATITYPSCGTSTD